MRSGTTCGFRRRLVGGGRPQAGAREPEAGGASPADPTRTCAIVTRPICGISAAEMPPKSIKTSRPLTLSVDKFWSWLQSHPNCILRAGTPETVLFDDDDYHWHFSSEEDGTLLVQLIRGKRYVGEIAVVPGDIAYVQVEPREQDEFLFELISETDKDRVAAYHFVLSHGYDAEEVATPGRWVH